MSKSKPTSTIKKIFVDASIIYTAVVLFVCLVLTGMTENPPSVSPLNFLFIFPFSLCFSLANYLHHSDRIGAAFKFILHFLLTVGGFFCFLYLPAFPNGKTASSVLVLFIVIVVYLFVYGIVLLLSRRWKREFQSEASYTPQFSNKDSNGRSNQ